MNYQGRSAPGRFPIETVLYLILHYMAEEATVRCAECLLRQAGEKQILIVDNGSPDGSGERLAGRFHGVPGVQVLKNETNLGYARGNNSGWNHWRQEHPGELPGFLVVLNNDLMIEAPGFQDWIRAEYEADPFGVLGPDIVSMRTGKHQSPAHAEPPSGEELEKLIQRYEKLERRVSMELLPAAGKALKRMLQGKKRDPEKPQTPRTSQPSQTSQTSQTPQPSQTLQTPQASPKPDPFRASPRRNVVLHGACLVFSRDFLKEREELFCPETFLYAEEEILAWQCFRAGIITRYAPSFQVLHLEDRSTEEALQSRTLLPEYRKEEQKIREKTRSLKVLRRIQREDLEAISRLGTIAPAKLSGEMGLSLTEVGTAFAGNTVNGSAFRKNALQSWYGPRGRWTFLAWCGPEGQVMVGVRPPDGDSSWSSLDTGFVCDLRDSHNSISLAVDGAGFLHLAYSAHNGALTLLRSEKPASAMANAVAETAETEEVKLSGLSFTEQALGLPEPDQPGGVTYPEFYLQPSGDLILLFRRGRSGAGSLWAARYEVLGGGCWQLLPEPLVAGGEDASPYWQACVDGRGRLHLSFTFRRRPDAGTNEHLYYMVSETPHLQRFLDSEGQPVALPADRERAERIFEIPEGADLLNQTSMGADRDLEPWIVSLWTEKGVFQYHLLHHTGQGWKHFNTGIRRGAFRLRGRGTKRLPCGRPQLLCRESGRKKGVLLLLRDSETGNRLCLAEFRLLHGEPFLTRRLFLTESSLGETEPLYDPERWRREGVLGIPVQYECYAPDQRPVSGAVTPLYLLEYPVPVRDKT